MAGDGRDMFDSTEGVTSLAELAGGVAHDLNNMLGPVLVYPDLLARHFEKDSDAYRDLMEIKQSAARAVEIVTDLQALARRGGGAAETVTVSEVVAEALAEPLVLELVARRADVRVEVKAGADTVTARVSRKPLRKALRNLIINAIEAIPGAGEVTICIRNGCAAQADACVGIGVHDTGPTFKPDDVPHVFDPFYVKKQTARYGTGLALAAVRAVALDLGGRVAVVSEPGAGTEFILCLPCAS